MYNHNFYWNSLSPWSGGEPTGAIKDAILAEYGSFEYFKEVFNSYASGHFGSGWTWLVQTADGSVTVSYELLPTVPCIVTAGNGWGVGARKSLNSHDGGGGSVPLWCPQSSK